MSINKSCLKVNLLKKRFNKGTMTLKYSGDSMAPTFKEGFMLTIKKTADLHEGDLIAFLKNNKLICHRLIIIHGDKCCAKGDGNEDPDPVLSRDKILGKVVEVRNPTGKKIPLFELKIRNLPLSRYYLLTYFMFKRLLSIRLAGILLRRPLIKIKKKIHRLIIR